MDLKINIGNLEGKSNWATWKFKVLILLRSFPSGDEVVTGKLTCPTPLSTGASEQEVNNFNNKNERFKAADIKAMLVLTSNMTEETLTKIMRFNSSREIWLELHRLYDGVSEDKTFDLCMQFFNLKHLSDDDMASHLSKVKNLWNNLNVELNTDSELPEILLICKILDTLPSEYFSFRSSWQLMPKSERTVENLTSQLCAHERALREVNANRNVSRADEEALTLSKRDLTIKKVPKKKFTCHYCKKEGHLIKNCIKWKRDGRPPKPESTQSNIHTLFVSHIFQAESDDINWYVDNGATHHICNNKKLFKYIKDFDTPRQVVTANGQKVGALGFGDVELHTSVGKVITLRDVWLVPSIHKNLFSVLAAHDRCPQSKFISSAGTCKFIIKNEVVMTGQRNINHGLYKLNLHNLMLSTNNIVASNHEGLMQLYHERLAHQDKRHTKEVIERELGIKLKADPSVCEGCVYGKAHKLKHGTRKRATVPGEVIHADVCGPFEKSFSGYKYYVLFKDDFSRFRHIFFLKEKSDVFDKFLIFLKECQKAGHTVKALQSDNGGEFDCHKMKEVLKSYSIEHLLIMPYSSEINGFIERDNRTVVEAARAILHSHGNLPQSLWAELINSVVHILNRTSKSGIPGKSPFELWTGKKPSIRHLKIIGCECYVHIPKQFRKKMDKKATKGTLVGYDFGGYRVWTGGKTIIRSRNVTFNEKPLIPSMTVRLRDDESEKEEESTKEEEQSESEEEDVLPYPDGDYFSSEEEKEQQNLGLRDRSKIKPPQRFNDFVNTLIMADQETPETYEEAVKSEDHQNWLKAMKTEMTAHNSNKTWTLVNPPKDAKVLPCRWIYKIKRNPDGSIEKYKARLVVKGFNQEKGINFNETFSPVARMSSIRTILSVAAHKGMDLAQFDVSTAFLYGTLDEKEIVYMHQPKGFKDGSKKVCKLNKSLYGLKQAARCWYERFNNFMTKLKFVPLHADPCIFVKNEDGNQLIVALYVDDGLVASTSKKFLEKFLNDLKSEFKANSKELDYYLGLEISKDEDGIIVHQKSYIKKILNKFGMIDCREVSTPILDNQDYNNLKDETTNYPYREAVGALMYLATSTRPDIAYAVSVVSRCLEKPTEQDVIKVKRIFRYLKGTQDKVIRYNFNSINKILAYSDADLGGDITTGRSTTGVIVIYSGGPVSWTSQRQTSVACSTTEAELVAASEATREIVWLRSLIESLSPSDATTIPTIFVDNEAAIRLAKNPEFHRRTKHIRIRHFFVREIVQDGQLEIKSIATQDQLADFLTKPLHGPRLKTLLETVGLK